MAKSLPVKVNIMLKRVILKRFKGFWDQKIPSFLEMRAAKTSFLTLLFTSWKTKSHFFNILQMT